MMPSSRPPTSTTLGLPSRKSSTAPTSISESRLGMRLTSHDRLRPAVRLERVLVEHPIPPCRRQPPRDMVWIVRVVMRVVGREAQHVVDGAPGFQPSNQLLRPSWLVERLSRYPHLLAKVICRPAADPSAFHPELDLPFRVLPKLPGKPAHPHI